MPTNNKQPNSGLGFFLGFKYSLSFSATCSRVVTLCGALLLVGCATQTYQPMPISPAQLAQQNVAMDHQDAAFRSYLEAQQYPLSNWPLKQFDLAALTLTAMYFNPAVRVLQSQIQVARAEETIAGQRPNPTLNFPDEPRDTLDFFGLVIDFIYERDAKRQARVAQAQAKRMALEFDLAQKSWAIYANLHKNLIEYYAAVQLGKLLLKQRVLSEESLRLLEQRVAVGQASEFELSSLRLELQQIELLLSKQRYISNDAFHRLIIDTGIQTEKFKHVGFVFSDLKKHLALEAAEIEQLQMALLHSRFDVKQSLAEYQAYEANLKLEIEKQYSDVTLSPGLLFEEGQALWVLAAAWTFPLFHNNDGQIEKALAERKRKQYEFIQLQTALISELTRKKQNYWDRLAAYQQSQQLVSALKTRGAEIEKQFKLGYSGKLTLLRSRLEIEKAKHAMLQIEVDVMRAGANLEDMTQSPIHGVIKEFDFMQLPQMLENKS